MDILFEKLQQKLTYTQTDFIRSIMDTIEWNARLVGIKGARGVGKTTLMLQYIKLHYPADQTALYVSLDDIWFSDHKLVDLTSQFVKRGGRHLFLDEVHKYPNWAQELKNIYDDYPSLRVVFTSSSLLEILNARADLSRRAVTYDMQGLSFREYLNMNRQTNINALELKDILENTLELSQQINAQINPLQHFQEYLKNGYYPFYREAPVLYYSKLEEIINMTLEIELPLLRGIDIAYITKLKQLLLIISESVPFVPNVSKLSERIGLNRTTFMSYLFYLQEAKLTRHIFKNANGISKLQKPDKIFLENTNLIYTLSPGNVNEGNLRETFFANQVGYQHQLDYSEQSDFLVDGKYTFEIGGSNKGTQQIKDLPDARTVADDLSYGIGNKIPLWMFGFLY